MNDVISAVDFFRDTLKQDVITLSMHSVQARAITLEALDGFVVQAAAKELLVEVWIEGERRDYEFGDYVKLLQRESNRVDISNPYLDDDYRTLHESDDEEASFHANARKAVNDMNTDMNHTTGWDDDGEPKG
jgi:hypothetical protein